MKSLITGGRGFIAGYLADYLVSLGDEVTIDSVNVVPGVYPGIDMYRPDRVFHLAGLTSVVDSFGRPYEYFETNTLGTLNVLEAARLADPHPKVLFASSGTRYNAASPYGFSKWAAEVVADAYYWCYKMPVYIARIFGTTGVGKKGDVVNDWCEQAVNSGHIRHGNLDMYRDISDVRDVVRALDLITESGTPGFPYDVGYGFPRSIREFAASFGVPLDYDPARVRPGERTTHEAKTNPLKALGYEPKYTFEETVAWVKESYR